MQHLHRPFIPMVILSCVGASASASFDRFLTCVDNCLNPPRGYWREVACVLDCQLELAGCVVTLGGTLAYAPSVDPTCLLTATGDGSLPGDPFSVGDQISFGLVLLGVDENYAFGDSDLVSDEAGYADLLAANQYMGPAAITDGTVRALRRSDAAALPDDPSLAFSDSLWESAAILYSGDFAGGATLDTTGLDAGLWILRTETNDATLGTQFGFSALVLVPAPGSAMLAGVSLLVAAKRRR